MTSRCVSKRLINKNKQQTQLYLCNSILLTVSYVFRTYWYRLLLHNKCICKVIFFL